MYFSSFNVSITLILLVLDPPAGPEKVPANRREPSSVRIPYSYVPGIDFSSNAYQRALSTLGKQVHKDTKHDMVACSKSPDVVPMDIGA